MRRKQKDGARGPPRAVPVWGYFRCFKTLLDVLVAHVGLDRPGIVLVVGQLEISGVPQHVGMHFDAEIGFGAGALDHAAKAGRRQWRAAL